MNKNTFQELIQSSHEQFKAILKDLTQQQFELTVDGGEWSIKDLVSHIAWYEAEMVNLLHAHSLKGSKWWDLPLDQRNEFIHQTYLADPLAWVIENENSIYGRMIDLLSLLSENDLNDPVAFANMPAEWQPWSVIASNTYEHYPEHIRQIKDCLKG